MNPQPQSEVTETIQEFHNNVCLESLKANVVGLRVRVRVSLTFTPRQPSIETWEAPALKVPVDQQPEDESINTTNQEGTLE